MSIRTIAIATAAALACFGTHGATPASAQSVSANPAISGQPGLVNPARICGVTIKCQTSTSGQSTRPSQPAGQRPRR